MPGTGVRILNVLLVEDNPGDVRLVAEVLRDCHAHVSLHDVDSGSKAILYLRRQKPYQNVARPDLILLDLNLPGRSGSEVLADIKSDALLKRIPVVVLSSSQSPSDIIRAYELHANCFISKPFTYPEFNRVIRSIENFWLQTAQLPSE